MGKKRRGFYFVPESGLDFGRDKKSKGDKKPQEKTLKKEKPQNYDDNEEVKFNYFGAVFGC